MKNISVYQSSFVRQTDQNNCGIACICMILRYAGRQKHSNELSARMDKFQVESSLLDLKNIVKAYDWDARCVQIDTDTLRELKSPLILHTISSNGRYHFVTLFAITKVSEGYLYIIGDPGHGIRIMEESELIAIWPSRTGLYIGNLSAAKAGCHLHSWKEGFDWHLIPRPLWYCIPLIHMICFIFAIALSALLQKLLADTAKTNDHKFRIAVLILLFIIIFCKGFLTWLRQQLLIRVNKIINTQLTIRLAEKALPTADKLPVRELILKKHLIDITKFQLSIHGVISVVLSDGLVLFMLLGCLLYLDVYAALITGCFTATTLIIAIKKTPAKVFSAMYLNDLYHQSEQMLLNRNISLENGTAFYDVDRFNSFYQKYIRQAGNNAIKLSKATLINQANGGLNLLIILGLEMSSGDKSSAFIVSVTVLSYLTTLFLQRINSVLTALFEGVQAASSLNN
jgi:ABC-type bacteriocin/lantibiotic exporter with double-glycine peptidase domain